MIQQRERVLLMNKGAGTENLELLMNNRFSNKEGRTDSFSTYFMRIPRYGNLIGISIKN